MKLYLFIPKTLEIIPLTLHIVLPPAFEVLSELQTPGEHFRVRLRNQLNIRILLKFKIKLFSSDLKVQHSEGIINIMKKTVLGVKGLKGLTHDR
jgi:hypothetical protein